MVPSSFLPRIFWMLIPSSKLNYLPKKRVNQSCVCHLQHCSQWGLWGQRYPCRVSLSRQALNPTDCWPGQHRRLHLILERQTEPNKDTMVTVFPQQRHTKKQGPLRALRHYSGCHRVYCMDKLMVQSSNNELSIHNLGWLRDPGRLLKFLFASQVPRKEIPPVTSDCS